MVDIKFTNIVNESKGLAGKQQANKSVDWFRKRALEIARNNVNTDPEDLINKAQPFKRLVNLSETSIGKMYMFIYDPKYKFKMPYYDTYPLVFPMEYYGDSFLGLNLHYLPPGARASFMDALYPYINNNKYDKTTKLRISYKILKEGARTNWYMRQCIKKYLFTHVKSNFLYIAPDEWEVAALLPTHNFIQSIGETDKSVSVSKIYRQSGSATF